MAWRIALSRRTEPPLGRNRPCNTRSSVLLPLPLAPISASRSPRGTRQVDP